MSSYYIVKFGAAAAAGATLFFNVSVDSDGVAHAQTVPTTLIEEGDFGLVRQRPAGSRDPNGPEFVVKYSRMYAGDFTYDQDGFKGRAIDCDDMKAGLVDENDPGKGIEWKLTGRFLARSLDIADGSSFDAAFDQGVRAVVGPTFIGSYKGHINGAHHPYEEQNAVSSYCNTRFPPSNE